MSKSILSAVMSGSSLLSIAARLPASEGNLTMADAAPYFVQYKEKFGQDCALSLDVFEELMGGAADDDALLQSMHDTQNSTDDDTSDRSVPDVIEAGSAWEYAKKLADPEFVEHLEKNAQAALENKRGAAVIRRDLVRLFGLETIESVWPIPGSTAKTHPGFNRVLHKYPKIVKDADGQDKPGEGDWYFDLFDGSPEGKALNAKISSLKAAKAGETGKHILPEHAKIAGDEIKLATTKAALDGFRTNKKNAIIRAVNLVQRMARINTETEAVAELCTIDGKPEGEPEMSNKLIYIRNSKDAKQFRILTIGQMLALSVDKAKAAGATYTALIGTTGRKPKTPETAQNIKVETVKAWDDTIAAQASFVESVSDASNVKAYNAYLTYLNGAGTDDLLLSMNKVMNFMEATLSKPMLAKRLQILLTSGKEEVKKAS